MAENKRISKSNLKQIQTYKLILSASSISLCIDIKFYVTYSFWPKMKADIFICISNFNLCSFMHDLACGITVVTVFWALWLETRGQSLVVFCYFESLYNCNFSLYVHSSFVFFTQYIYKGKHFWDCPKYSYDHILTIPTGVMIAEFYCISAVGNF